MKQEIILKLTPNPFVEIDKVSSHDYTGVYVAVTDFPRGADACVLRYEFGNGGYIFRNIRDQSGHSGHHETVRAACAAALNIRDTKVYRFDTFAEAIASGLLGD